MAEETASCGSPAAAGESCWEYICHQVKDTLDIPLFLSRLWDASIYCRVR